MHKHLLNIRIEYGFQSFLNASWMYLHFAFLRWDSYPIQPRCLKSNLCMTTQSWGKIWSEKRMQGLWITQKFNSFSCRWEETVLVASGFGPVLVLTAAYCQSGESQTVCVWGLWRRRGPEKRLQPVTLSAEQMIHQLMCTTHLRSWVMMVPRNGARVRDMFPQLHMLPLSDRKSVIHLHVEFSWESLSCCRAGIMMLKAEPKSTNRILAWVPAESRCGRMKWRAMLTALSTDL